MAKTKIDLKDCVENNKFKDGYEELSLCKKDCESCDMMGCLYNIRKKLAMIYSFVDKFQDGVASMTIEVIRDKIENPEPLKKMTKDDNAIFI